MAPNIHHSHLLSSSGPIGWTTTTGPGRLVLPAHRQQQTPVKQQEEQEKQHVNIVVVTAANNKNKDYQPSTPVLSAAESADYWHWETPKDWFSADRITAHLQLTTIAAAADVLGQKNADHQHKYDSSNDDYWAETTAPAAPTPINYWDERDYTTSSSTSTSKNTTSSTSNNKNAVEEEDTAYWAEARAPRHYDGEETIAAAAVAVSSSHPLAAATASYWDEANHAQPTSSSSYWAESQDPIHEDDDDNNKYYSRCYWQWSSTPTQPTARDRYWAM